MNTREKLLRNKEQVSDRKKCLVSDCGGLWHSIVVRIVTKRCFWGVQESMFWTDLVR
ncbi:MAG: hypothetical protein UZ01_00332 [Candidatus Brocadia sinica]|nr:MAG: hypothetical protein UZ01_00332 [Candidatus Brocadia sinica]